MLNAKLLLASGAVGAAAWQVGSDPRWLHVVLNATLAVAICWLAFVAVFFLTAAHSRRTARRQRSTLPGRGGHRLRSHAWRIRAHTHY